MKFQYLLMIILYMKLKINFFNEIIFIYFGYILKQKNSFFQKMKAILKQLLLLKKLLKNIKESVFLESNLKELRNF